MPGADQPERQAANGIDAVPASWTTGGEDDRSAQFGSARRMSCPDLFALRPWPGVRRAGRPTAEPGADAGPAAPQAPRLIQVRLNSALHRATGQHGRAIRQARHLAGTPVSQQCLEAPARRPHQRVWQEPSGQDWYSDLRFLGFGSEENWSPSPVAMPRV